MTTDFAQMERQFLASLKTTTGRDLLEWMAAIDTEALPHRNDIIDWLRQQGFPFARASWLERIHGNGGRPLYPPGAEAKERLGVARSRPPARAKPAPPPERKSATVIVLAERAGASSPIRAQAKSATPLAPSPELETLLAKAKAYRPLAQFVLREIDKAIPGCRQTARASHISIGAPAEFAILATSPRELRLGLGLGPAPHDGTLQKAKFGAGLDVPAGITHMIVLTDARQVNADLLRHVREAASRAGRGADAGH